MAVMVVWCGVVVLWCCGDKEINTHEILLGDDVVAGLGGES